MENTLNKAKSREDQLKISEDKLQTIVNNIPKFIFWKGKDLAFLGCNNLFATLAGLSSSAEIVGKTDHDFWGNEAEIYRADDLKVMESKQPKLDYEEQQTNGEGKNHLDANQQGTFV